MKKYKALIPLLAIIFFSCEKAIDVDMPFENSKMVLNGFLNPDSTFQVQVSRSKFILDYAELKNLTDARVSIFQGEKKLGDLLHQENGRYELEGIKPEPEKSYTIRAEHESFETVSATEKVLAKVIPEQVKIEEREIEESYGTTKSYGTTNQYRFSFTLKDPPGEKNYYMFRAQVRETYEYYDQNGELVSNSHINPLSLEGGDPNLEDVCYYGCGLMLSDSFFDGKAHEVKLSARSNVYRYGGGNGAGDDDEDTSTAYLEVYHISEAAYLYYKTLHQSQNPEGDPFSEPVIVYSNIEGGYGAWVSATGTMIEVEE